MSGFYFSAKLRQRALTVNVKFIATVVGAIVCSVLSIAANASQSLSLPEDIYKEERARYLEVEKKLLTYSKRRVRNLDNDIYELAEYPLYPYLLRLKLDRTMSIRTKREVKQFLADFNGQPVSYGLRYKWLNYLAKNNYRSTFLDNYRPGMGARLTCIALNYRLKEGESEQVLLQEVNALWLHGQSQPDECDPLFAKWKKAGMMTPEMVIKRIEIAAKEGNRSIISYLKRQLPSNKQYLADAWLSVTRDTSRVSKTALFPLKHASHEANIIVWAVEKLAWRNPDLASQVYSRYNNKKVFSQAQQHMMRRAIALSYTLDRLPQAHHWLELADVDGASDDVKLWHISHLLRTNKWQEVVYVINSAPASLQQEENYRYWKARALEALGQSMQATVLYKELAQERHYYGFMASAHIGEIPSLAHTPAPRDTAAIASVAKTPATMRAVEFFRLDRTTEARREWYYLLSHLPEAKVTDAGILAYEWGLYDQAITSFARSGYWDDVERRFPLAFSDVFSKKSQAYSCLLYTSDAADE